MASRDSRSEYERRMHRVLEHIDRELDQPLDLATLAEVAHFSPFHFHRLFAAWMGETLGDYLRRRRVELAAMRLLSQPRLTVLNAALSVGFGSGEAFSHAFKSRFGCSPSSLRNQHARERRGKRNSDQVHSNRDQVIFHHDLQHGVSRNPQLEVPMKVTLVDRVPAPVAYLRHTGPYGEPLARFWQETVYPWLAQNALLGQARYGLSHDDPSITESRLCRYDAGVEVPPQFTLPGNALTTIVPGGRYAVLHFEGTVDEIGDVWNRLLRDWLPSSGFQLDARPCFEYYPTQSKYDPRTGVFDCDICIPVAPL
jgi:AraC family transcriptional regulator